MQDKIGVVAKAKYYHDRPQVLLKDSSKEKQINHFFIKQILFKRWSDLRLMKKELIILKLTISIIIKQKSIRLTFKTIKKYLKQLKNTKTILIRNPYF